MSNSAKYQLKAVMTLAWQFVKRNGFTMSEALRTAWRNIKLKTRLHIGIVKFYFQKVDGSIREAYGTLKSDLLPPTQGNDTRKKNDTVQVYYDTEAQGYRCFKMANLVKFA